MKLGSRMQSVLMLLKIAAIAGLIGAGLFLVRSPHPLLHPVLDRAPSFDLLTAIGAAMVPVLFAFGGWQTTNFIAEEMKDPRKNLSRALVMGVAGVIVLYVGVNFVCVRTLGPQGLADTQSAGDRGDAGRNGRCRCAADCAGNRCVDAGISEPVGSDRAARLFRHGARWTVLSERGQSHRSEPTSRWWRLSCKVCGRSWSRSQAAMSRF